MHKGLELEEIFSLICNHLADAGCDDDLACLARTTRRFTDVALNALWEEQTSLVPLLRTMPADLWEVGFEENTDDEDVITDIPALKPRRSLVASDWTPRFEFYSSKIKSYEPWTDKFPSIHPDCFKVIASYNPFRPLLPNLKRVGFSTTQHFAREQVPYTAVLLGPRVEEVSIENIPERFDQFDLAFLFASLVRCCPTLKILEMNGQGEPGQQPTLCQTLQVLNGLEDFRSHEQIISNEAFNQISKLPNLHTLWLNMFPSNQEDNTPTNKLHLDGPATGRFINVRKVDLRTPNWNVGADILRSFSHPLHSITVHDEGDAPPDMQGLFFERLMKFLSQNPHFTHSLRQLDIASGLTMPDWTFTGERVDQALDCLLHLEGLEDLDLTISGAEHLTDTWLLKVSSHWPKMQRFVVYGIDEAKPQFTIAGVIPLIERWPHLVEIMIAALWAPFTAPHGIRNLAITTIAPGPRSYFPPNSQQETDLRVIAHSLKELLPRLEKLELYGQIRFSSPPEERVWEDLRALITGRDDVQEDAEMD